MQTFHQPSPGLHPTGLTFQMLPQKKLAWCLLALAMYFLCLATNAPSWKQPLAFLRVRKRQYENATKERIRDKDVSSVVSQHSADSGTSFEQNPPHHAVWPAPMLAFSEWQAQHSVRALLEESLEDQRHRKFILGTFSCPQQAGNLIHDFTTSLLLAMVTNRTLLWQYYITHPKWAKDNQRENCDRLLHMQDWIPSYVDWHDVYNLTDPVHVAGVEPGGWNLTALYQVYDKGNRLVPREMSRRHERESFISVGKVRTLTSHYELWAGLVFLSEDFSYTFLSQLLGFEDNPHTHHVIGSLYEQGVEFLFGMLFRQSFEFTPGLIASVTPSVNVSNSENLISLGVHSRHAVVRDDGSHIQREVNCLRELLEELRPAEMANETSDCVIYIMTDRPATRDALLQAARELDCQGVVAIDIMPAEDTSFVSDGTTGATISNSEHGPWAGAGFFRDVWLLATQVRSGFVGYDRSSSALVYEWMVYDAMLFDGAATPPLRCSLGYN